MFELIKRASCESAAFAYPIKKQKKRKKKRKEKIRQAFFAISLWYKNMPKYFEKNKLTVGDFFLIEWTTIQDF